MGSTLTLPVPADYLLARDANSYGYVVLDPYRWDPPTRSFTATLDLGDRAATIRVSQPDDCAAPRRRRAVPSRGRGACPGTPGAPLRAIADAMLTADERILAKTRLTRILRLDEPAETIARFHTLDPRWRKSGRGRLMRSASFFEDVIKTVTSCNVAWPSTVRMNRRLCEVYGRRSPSGLHAFPTARKLARVHPASLRQRCGVGYRDERIVQLAKLFSASPRRGGIDQAWFQDPATPDEAVHAALIDLPGIGPYAAANIMQLQGRYARLPVDTESVRHGRAVLGYTGPSKRIMRAVHDHYAPFGEHAFRSYWFELWDFYEKAKGPAWTWSKEADGASFTAAQMKAWDLESPG